MGNFLIGILWRFSQMSSRRRRRSLGSSQKLAVQSWNFTDHRPMDYCKLMAWIPRASRSSLSNEEFLICSQEYWWAVLLMGVAFVLFMGVFIKCCAVHTPSSNPKKPPALSITQTLRHPYSTLRRKRHGPSHQPHHQPAPSAPYIAAPNPSGPPPQAHGEHRNQYTRPKGTAGSD